MNTSLPTADEIMLTGSRDEQHALENFLVKTLEQAQELFRANFLSRQEDLSYMGPVAFRFYVPAAINYLASPEADSDSDAASSFCHLIESRLAQEPAEVAPVKSVIYDGILAILEDFDRFNCRDYVYGDVAGRYRSLLASLDALTSHDASRTRRRKRRG